MLGGIRGNVWRKDVGGTGERVAGGPWTLCGGEGAMRGVEDKKGRGVRVLCQGWSYGDGGWGTGDTGG